MQGLSPNVGINSDAQVFFATEQGAPYLLANTPYAFFPCTDCNHYEVVLFDLSVPAAGCPQQNLAFPQPHSSDTATIVDTQGLTMAALPVNTPNFGIDPSRLSGSGLAYANAVPAFQGGVVPEVKVTLEERDQYGNLPQDALHDPTQYYPVKIYKKTTRTGRYFMYFGPAASAPDSDYGVEKYQDITTDFFEQKYLNEQDNGMLMSVNAVLLIASVDDGMELLGRNAIPQIAITDAGADAAAAMMERNSINLALENVRSVRIFYLDAGEQAALAPTALTPAQPCAGIAAEGTGARTWQEYQSAVNNMYGGQAPFSSLKFSTADGNWIADNVVNIGGNQVAIESKFIGSGGWAGSIYNPASPVGNLPFALAEQADTLAQAQAYSTTFDQVIYHSNSPEFIQYYSSVFNNAGIQNIKFILTK
jgi:hypothetical protein